MKNFTLGSLLLLLTCNLFAQSSQVVTWSDNVACIMYSHCTSCHNPNGGAPFSLVDYADAQAYAVAIKSAVEDRRMPPWPPNPDYNKLAHERILSADEIQKISDWVTGGAVEGNPANAPAAPVYSSAWTISSPDLTERIPDYVVPTISQDLYRCFTIPTNFSTDMYITGVEVIPGNKEIVHHVLVFQDTSNIVLGFDSLDPGPGWTSFGGTGSGTSELVGGWVPGSDGEFMPAGMGMLLPAGANLILQIHYPNFSSGQLDSTRINLQMTASQVRPMLNKPALNHYGLTNGPLFVPKNTIKTFHAEYTIPSIYDVSLVSIAPHAHLICEAMWAYAVTPTNDTIQLIEIPKWDFHWQGTYQFQKVIHLPPGTVLHGYARYNNTQLNPNNPNFPPKDVSVGDATTDEMLLFYMTVTFYLPGDENKIIDTASHPAHYLGCDPLVIGLEEDLREEEIAIFPNPAQNWLNLKGEIPQGGSFSLLSMQGREVARFSIQPGHTLLDVSPFARGLYLGVIRDMEGVMLRKKKVVLGN